jgi:hypothetical protein
MLPMTTCMNLLQVHAFPALSAEFILGYNFYERSAVLSQIIEETPSEGSVFHHFLGITFLKIKKKSTALRFQFRNSCVMARQLGNFGLT